MSPDQETSLDQALITRREAIQRVSAMLGGVALIGGSTLLTACRDDRARREASATGVGAFTPADIAFLDEVAETMLPETSTPGAKAARVGAFMALMVTDTYDANDQRIFREGMQELDKASRKANGVAFMQATPPQRLALLEALDREQKEYIDARERARGARREEATKDPEASKAEARLPDQRKEGAIGAEAGGAAAITADAPNHYFRMIKELALLGYFTSEIGYTQAMRYTEAPGRFDPCVPYRQGERAWAPHA
jgi:hypothetical protein